MYMSVILSSTWKETLVLPAAMCVHPFQQLTARINCHDIEKHGFLYLVYVGMQSTKSTWILHTSFSCFQECFHNNESQYYSNTHWYVVKHCSDCTVCVICLRREKRLCSASFFNLYELNIQSKYLCFTTLLYSV